MPLKPACLTLIGCMLFVATLGCEQKDAQPAPPKPAPAEAKPETPSPSNDVLPKPDDGDKPEDEIVAMLRGEKAKPEPAEPSPTTGQLPAGHPPINTPESSAGSPHMGMPQADALSFSAPEAWVTEPPKNSFRRAQYRLSGEGDGKDGEVVVFFFGPGQGGDNESNIGRWISQFKKADGSPLTADDVNRNEDSSELPTTTVEFAGTFNAPAMMGAGSNAGPHENYRLIAGIIEVGQDRWFVKATGPDQTITAHRDEIYDYIKSAAPQK